MTNGGSSTRFQILPQVISVLTIAAFFMAVNVFFYNVISGTLEKHENSFETKEAANLRHELVISKLESLARDIARLQADIGKLKRP